MRRLDEEGPEALVQVREPVNKYPLYIRYAVQRLKVLCPTLGKAKITQFVGRAGLHLAVSSVGRFLKEALPRNPPDPAVDSVLTGIESRGPNHIWLADLTTVPITFGFWLSWLPFSLPQRWPYCWWVAIVIDHFSRRLMGFAIFTQQPSSLAVRTFMGRLMRQAKAKPRHLITDQGEQFRAPDFKVWADRHGIRQRFGAIGKHGSIAVIERLMRTIKQECTRRLTVPYAKREFHNELRHFTSWYNTIRPHDRLQAATPDEVYRGVPSACLDPRFEPRPHWPRHSPCAGQQAKIRGRPGAQIAFQVRYLAGRKHLPIVSLKHIA